MAKYLVVLRIVIRNKGNDRIMQEITREKNIDCDSNMLREEISKKKDLLRNKFMEIWKDDDDASIDVLVSQIVSL